MRKSILLIIGLLSGIATYSFMAWRDAPKIDQQAIFQQVDAMFLAFKQENLEQAEFHIDTQLNLSIKDKSGNQKQYYYLPMKLEEDAEATLKAFDIILAYELTDLMRIIADNPVIKGYQYGNWEYDLHQREEHEGEYYISLQGSITYGENKEVAAYVELYPYQQQWKVSYIYIE